MSETKVVTLKTPSFWKVFVPVMILAWSWVWVPAIWPGWQDGFVKIGDMRCMHYEATPYEPEEWKYCATALEVKDGYVKYDVVYGTRVDIESTRTMMWFISRSDPPREIKILRTLEREELELQKRIELQTALDESQRQLEALMDLEEEILALEEEVISIIEEHISAQKGEQAL